MIKPSSQQRGLGDERRAAQEEVETQRPPHAVVGQHCQRAPPDVLKTCRDVQEALHWPVRTEPHEEIRRGSTDREREVDGGARRCARQLPHHRRVDLPLILTACEKATETLDSFPLQDMELHAAIRRLTLARLIRCTRQLLAESDWHQALLLDAGVREE